MVDQSPIASNIDADTESSEAQCRARLFTDPNDVVAMRRLGWLCGQSGRMAEARDLLDRALAIAPQSVNLQVTAAELAAQDGDPEAAEPGYRKALALDPNAAAAQVGLGRIAYERGQWQIAEQYHRAALRVAPEAINGLFGMGLARLAQGDAQQAVQWFLRAAQLYPKNPLALTHYARVMLVIGDVQAAARPVIRALELAPDLLLARQLHGQVELARGQPAAAERAFHAVLAKTPDEPEAHAGLGHALRAQQRLAEAITHFDIALAARDDDENLVADRAACLLQSGQADTAVSDLRAYIDAHPRCEIPRVLLASVLDGSGHADEALAFWQAACAANADDGLAHAELARRQEAAGDFAASAESVARSGDDKRAPIALLRARSALRQADAVAAQRELLAMSTKSLPPEQASERYRLLGVVHDSNRRYAEALLAFREAQRIGATPLPELPDANIIEPLLQPVLSLDELQSPRTPAPILLLGLPGSRVEDVAALLNDQDGMIIRHDRFKEHYDLFGDPTDPRLLSPLSQAELGMLAKRYARAQQRAVPVADALVIDWIPVLDVRVLAQARRALPGLRAIRVDAPDREAAFLRWLAFGWANCHAVDPLQAARWWHRAADHLALVDAILPTEHVRAEELLADAEPSGDGLAAFLDVASLGSSGVSTQTMRRDRRAHAAQFGLASPTDYRGVLGEALAAL